MAQSDNGRTGHNYLFEGFRVAYCPRSPRRQLWSYISNYHLSRGRGLRNPCVKLRPAVQRLLNRSPRISSSSRPRSTNARRAREEIHGDQHGSSGSPFLVSEFEKPRGSPFLVRADLQNATLLSEASDVDRELHAALRKI